MTMLADVLGAAVPGAKNRICTLWRRRKAKSGNDPSSTGMFVGKCLIAVLICAASALMMSDAATAKSRKGGAKASAPAPASHPARSTARPGVTIKRLSPRFRTQTESSRAATSTRKPGSA